MVVCSSIVDAFALHTEYRALHARKRYWLHCLPQAHPSVLGFERAEHGLLERLPAKFNLCLKEASIRQNTAVIVSCAKPREDNLSIMGNDAGG